MNLKDVRCWQEAGTRCGVLKRAEVLGFMTKQQLGRRVATGALVRVFPGVFRVAGAPETWRQKLEALTIWAGKGAVLSHKTAARLHGFSRFKDDEALEVTLTSQQRPPSGVKVHRTDALLKADIDEVDDLAVTSAARTLMDLSVRTDHPTLRATLDEALRRKLTTVENLQAALEGRKGRPGAPELLALTQEFDGGDGPTESELEAAMLDLILSAGLPRPTRQKRGNSGDKRVRVDFLFEEQGVILEGDGYEHHSGVEEFEAERERNNLLTASGFFVLHWTWRALHDKPVELLRQLLATLNSRRR